ncbi:MAG: hypothetical protein ACYCSO_02475 [Cuniculiplasma sp.]
MKNQNNKSLKSELSGILNSGSLSISVNEKTFSEMKFHEGNVDIIMNDRKLTKKISKMVPHTFKRLRYIHRISSYLDRSGVTLTVEDKNGLILRIGKGAHSMFGNFEAKLIKIKEYF